MRSPCACGPCHMLQGGIDGCTLVVQGNLQVAGFETGWALKLRSLGTELPAQLVGLGGHDPPKTSSGCHSVG